MATSAVEICNNALIKIGANTITALSDDSKPARLCNIMYSILRDDLLRSHPWNFAVTRVALAQVAGNPVFGFTYHYQLPTNNLRVLRINDSDVEYRIEQDRLLTDANAVNLVYIAQITDTTAFDSNFDNVLALRLASELAYTITSNARVAQALKQEYEKEYRRAKMNDAQEDSIYVLQTDTFTDAHLIGEDASGITFESES